MENLFRAKKFVALVIIVLTLTILVLLPKDNVSSQSDELAWQVFDSPTTEHLLAIEMVSESEGWAVGNNGAISLYRDGQWENYRSPTTQDLWKISMVSSNEGWAIGSNITLYYLNGTWSISDMYRPDQLYDIKMLSPEDGWIVGGNDAMVVMRYTRDEFGILDWYVQDLDVDMGPLRAIDMYSSLSGMVGSSTAGGGGIWLYDDGNWSQIWGTSQE